MALHMTMVREAWVEVQAKATDVTRFDFEVGLVSHQLLAHVMHGGAIVSK